MDPPERLWWMGDSAWLKFMQAQGFAVVDPEDPFFWSTDLTRRAWIACGISIVWYVALKWPKGVPLKIVCHSHAIQGIAYAAYYGLEIDTLISIGPPLRKDMELQYQALRFRTKKWITVHAKEPDEMAILGGFDLDGDLSDWKYPPKFNADYRDIIPGVSHSKVLYDPEYFKWWTEAGWLDLMKAESWKSRLQAKAVSATLHRLPNLFRRLQGASSARSMPSVSRRQGKRKPSGSLSPIAKADGIQRSLSRQAKTGASSRISRSKRG